MYFVAALCSVLIASYVGSEELPETRIENGTETNTNNIPYQVSIEAYKAFRCSGSIIQPSWVLTVASCIDGVHPTDISVRANSPLRGILGVRYEVLSSLLHPDYNRETMDNDIALLQFNGTTNYSVSIAQEVPFEGQTATVSGWGTPSPGDWLSSQLTEKEATIMYFNDCKYLYEGIGNPITERMLCASSTGGGPCQGDTGDPLVYDTELIGMMSFSFGCGEGKFPTVYTDVTKFFPWIENKTFSNS